MGGVVKSMLLYSLYKQIIRYKFVFCYFSFFFVFLLYPRQI
jgi:hypothetical protein